MSEELNVAIVGPNREKYTETFVRAHVDYLPANTVYMYGFGGYLPWCYGDGRGIFRDNIIIRGIFFVAERFFRLTPEYFLSKALVVFLKKRKIAAVVAEYGQTGAAMGPVCQKADVPLVVFFHGYDAFNTEELKMYRGRYLKMFSQAAAIVAVSKDMQKQLELLGAPPDKLHYTPCSPDVELFPYHDAGKNSPVFLAVGRLVASKSPHLTILAFKKVVDAVPEAKLIFVGDGELEEACMILAQSLGIERSVSFRGVLPHEEVRELMQQARAFVQHSFATPVKNDKEGTPVAIQEAGASGLPVISTRHAGIPEVVEHGKTGFIVEEGDIEGMAKYMLDIARDPELASRIGKQAAEHIRANYTMRHHIDKLWEIIQEVVAGES